MHTVQALWNRALLLSARIVCTALLPDFIHNIESCSPRDHLSYSAIKAGPLQHISKLMIAASLSSFPFRNCEKKDNTKLTVCHSHDVN
jgi:hypothetical protein